MKILHLLVSRQTQTELEYKTPLQSNNGRNPLVDTLQEKLDSIMYLRQAIEDMQDGVVFTFSKNFHVAKEPKPVSRTESKKIIDLIIHDTMVGLDKIKYNKVPKWLKSVYAAEITSTLYLLQNIENYMSKYTVDYTEEKESEKDDSSVN